MNAQAIELTEWERTILVQIKLDASMLRDHIDAKRNGEAVRNLMKSLLERDAIPEVRVKYFTDPNYKVGGRGTSRQGHFERKGIIGEAIFEHRDFLPYLRYFIEGCRLPQAVIDAFRREVSDCGTVTSGDIVPLGRFAQQQVRSHHLDPRQASEEFYKLSLDCGLGPDDSSSIRNAVRRSR